MIRCKKGHWWRREGHINGSPWVPQNPIGVLMVAMAWMHDVLAPRRSEAELPHHRAQTLPAATPAQPSEECLLPERSLVYPLCGLDPMERIVSIKLSLLLILLGACWLVPFSRRLTPRTSTSSCWLFVPLSPYDLMYLLAISVIVHAGRRPPPCVPLLFMESL